MDSHYPEVDLIWKISGLKPGLNVRQKCKCKCKRQRKRRSHVERKIRRRSEALFPRWRTGQFLHLRWPRFTRTTLTQMQMQMQMQAQPQGKCMWTNATQMQTQVQLQAQGMKDLPFLAVAVALAFAFALSQFTRVFPSVCAYICICDK